MFSALKSKSDKTQASASVVDGKLILSFPHAQTPVLWQMDLAQAKSSALEVLKLGKGETYSLTLKTQKGEQVQVASFDNREDALEGLMAASDALKNAHGNILIAANEDKKVALSPAARKKQSKGQWITGIVAIVALALLFGLWGATSPKTPSSISTTSPAAGTTTQTTSGSSAAETSGVPISADDFLSGQ